MKKHGPSKSLAEEKVYLGILHEMFADLCEHYPSVAASLRRDIRVISDRVLAEGVRFLTTRLPLIGKELDQVTSGKTFRPIPGFTQDAGWKHPRLLGGLLRLVVTNDGVLNPDASPNVVSSLRQVCFLFYKLELPYLPELEARCIERFREVERDELAQGTPAASSVRYDGARELLANLLGSFDPKDIKPGHGPGSVATGEMDENKWCFKRLYSSIHHKYPYYEYFVVGTDHLLDKVSWYRALERLEFPEAKVVTVPKDSRGPRIISMEPLELQYMQQGLMRKLVPFIELHPLTRGHVNFTDQSINRNLALHASVEGDWATLDLKDASDRVSKDLVWWFFGYLKTFRDCVFALRSVATVLPDGSTLRLNKFAPMGSAICFPIEALIFWAIAVVALTNEGVSLRSALASVYVMGDDIIVPTVYAEVVCTALTELGLTVNREKSCISGLFRESCGMDAFKGVCVTPTRLKHRWNQRPSNGAVCAHYLAFANAVRRLGYRHTATFVWSALEEVYGKLPYAPTSRYFLAKEADLTWDQAFHINVGTFPMRWSANYQRVEIKSLRLRTKVRETTLNGWARVLRNLTGSCGERPDEVHLSKGCQIRTSWGSFPGVSTGAGLELSRTDI